MLRDAILERVVKEKFTESEMTRYAAEVAEHKRDPYSLVEEMLKAVVKG